MSRTKLAIDIGGTFIDVVVFDLDTKALSAFKLPTTPHDPAEGVVAAVGQLGVAPEAVADFVHGTTLGLNAILERKGANVGIITNAGFRDIYDRPGRRRFREHVSLRPCTAAPDRRAPGHRRRAGAHDLRGRRGRAARPGRGRGGR